jgi:hypothetical protein
MIFTYHISQRVDDIVIAQRKQFTSPREISLSQNISEQFVHLSLNVLMCPISQKEISFSETTFTFYDFFPLFFSPFFLFLFQSMHLHNSIDSMKTK